MNKEKLDKALAAVDNTLDVLADNIAELICERQGKNMDMTDDVFVEKLNRLHQKLNVYQNVKFDLECNQCPRKSFFPCRIEETPKEEAPAETPAEEAPKEEVPEAPAETPKPKRSSRRKGANVNE